MTNSHEQCGLDIGSRMLITTVDYEVFGNGMGCLEKCVRRPAEKLLSVAERFSAPITLFVEALEMEAMQKASVDGIEPVITQLKQASQNNHDIQLHIHPQWDNAKLDGGRWRLKEDQWRIGDIDDDIKVISLLEQGKKWLESLLAPVDPQYRCNVFRAGGWAIQPSEKVISALVKLQFEIDSTVAPGLRNMTKGEWSNFVMAPEKPYWKTAGDVCIESPSGIWEVPITTGKIGRLKHLRSIQKARSFGSGGMADGCVGDYAGSGSATDRFWGKVGKLSRLGAVMLDLSTMPADVLIDITEQWIDRFSETDYKIPIVAIAHTKNFTEASEKNMSDYFSWIKSEGISFSTYREWLELMNG